MPSHLTVQIPYKHRQSLKRSSDNSDYPLKIISVYNTKRSSVETSKQSRSSGETGTQTFQVGQTYTTVVNALAAINAQYQDGTKFKPIGNPQSGVLWCEFRRNGNSTAGTFSYLTNCKAQVRLKEGKGGFTVTSADLTHDHHLLPLHSFHNPQPFKQLFNKDKALPEIGQDFGGIVKSDLLLSMAEYATLNSLPITVAASGSPIKTDFSFRCNSKDCTWSWKVARTSGSRTKEWKVMESQLVHNHQILESKQLPNTLKIPLPTPVDPSPTRLFSETPSVVESKTPLPSRQTWKPLPPSISTTTTSIHDTIALRTLLLKIDSQGSLLRYESKLEDAGFDLGVFSTLSEELQERFLIKDVGMPWMKMALITSHVENNAKT